MRAPDTRSAVPAGRRTAVRVGRRPRVAVRAGVSVGTLFRYHPNKRALLAVLLEEHLVAMGGAVVAARPRVRGTPTTVMVPALAAGPAGPPGLPPADGAGDRRG